jgi:hypothetical protein
MEWMQDNNTAVTAVLLLVVEVVLLGNGLGALQAYEARRDGGRPAGPVAQRELLGVAALSNSLRPPARPC